MWWGRLMQNRRTLRRLILTEIVILAFAARQEPEPLCRRGCDVIDMSRQGCQGIHSTILVYIVR